MSATLSVEIEALMRELDLSLMRLKDAIDSVTTFNMDDRQRRLAVCDRLIDSVRTSKEAILLEGRNCSHAERAIIEPKLRNRMETFRELCERFQFKKSEMDKEQLQAEAEAQELDDYNEKDQMQQLIAKGDAIQDATQGAITNMAGLVADAEGIGLDTVGKMDQQIEQLQRVGQNLDDVQHNSKRARQTAAQMARSASSDLCIRILCGSIIACVVTIVVLVNV